MKVLKATHQAVMCLILCLPFLLIGCGGDDDSTDLTVARIEILDKSELATTPIAVGRELFLGALAMNKEGFNITFGGDALFGETTRPITMRWSSSNLSVASITPGDSANKGVLRAISPGQTTITAEASGVRDSVKITVVR